uniref:Uncharacterized protein n=1 Tax=Medicago truncatula TaxID=3880 RepID=I3SV83_MEDTR|nr:unknown [Medicago truncatula]
MEERRGSQGEHGYAALPCYRSGRLQKVFEYMPDGSEVGKHGETDGSQGSFSS